MAPRIFTIASHHNTQKNVIVAASLTENGLISKFFKSSPKSIRAEIRKSTFSDAMRWKKVIFIAAGTGLAPFRAYIQEKIYNVNQKKEGKDVNVPIITLFFGCKHETGDFIYKD
jgi:sulfite reductase alpha subunit-like flavoprotein